MLADDRSAAGIPDRDSDRRLEPPVARRLRAVAADGRPEGAGESSALAPALVKAFEQAKDDDPRVRQYLALALGRLIRRCRLRPSTRSPSLDEPAPSQPDWFSG